MSTLDADRRTAALRLIDTWHHRARKMEKAHYASATSCRNLNYALGVPLVVITTIIASDVFGVLEEIAREFFPFTPVSEPRPLAWFVAALTLLAPVLAALQTFLRFPERAQQHRNAAVKFGILKREMEELRTFPPETPAEMRTRMHDIKQREIQAVEESPTCGTLSLYRTRRAMARDRAERRESGARTSGDTLETAPA